MTVTRFAPSPSGNLHLGHAFSAITAARAAGGSGTFLVRIDDIDQVRMRPEFMSAILDDLRWLGLKFPEPVRIQSAHLADYQSALEHVQQMGLTYPCFCTRGQIAAEIAAAGHAPHGPDGPIYPGTCRNLDARKVAENLSAGLKPAIRLNAMAASAKVGRLQFSEHDRIVEVMPQALGDIVLARRDAGYAYHLAVVVDDAAHGVDLVTRGDDLLHATHIQRVLQALLGLPVPAYAHHRLILDEYGQRFAKRNQAASLIDMRRRGLTPEDIYRQLGFDA